jgi:hypothetical protein
VRHNLLDEEIDGAHRLIVGQTTPLKRTHEVIGASGNIFIHIRADGVRRAGDDAKTSPAAVPTDAPWRRSPTPLGLGEVAHTVALTVRFSVGQACRSPVHVAPEELRQAALLGLQPTWSL